jgi:nucleoid-associated protein YgaU
MPASGPLPARQNPTDRTRTMRTLAADPLKSDTGSTTAAATEKHIIQPGESLAVLARRYYGSEKYTDFLIKSNPQITDPSRLHIGDAVNIPAQPNEAGSSTGDAGRVASASRSTAEGNSSRRTYKVREGESFYSIARDQLGDALRWPELFDLNRSLVQGDAASLRIGQEILLPAAQ